MQTMSECLGHICLPHLQQKGLIFLVLLSTPKVYRAFLFNKVPFPARVRFPFLIAEVGATGCASSLIPHSSFHKNLVGGTEF